MPKQRFERNAPTHKWQQLRPLLKDPTQLTYEIIRPVILGWETPKERSAETGMPQRTIYYKANLFDQCQRLCKFGSSNFLVKRWEKLFLLLSSRPSTLGIVQEPLPQERDASTAIHGSFERLQFIDLSLGNALAPRQTQSSMHGVIVLLDPGHEAPQFRNATFGSLLHPGRQIVMFALAHHREKG